MFKAAQRLSKKKVS
jgi:hypothetical protein